jgi:hypothetical protein
MQFDDIHDHTEEYTEKRAGTADRERLRRGRNGGCPPLPAPRLLAVRALLITPRREAPALGHGAEAH